MGTEETRQWIERRWAQMKRKGGRPASFDQETLAGLIADYPGEGTYRIAERYVEITGKAIGLPSVEKFRKKLMGQMAEPEAAPRPEPPAEVPSLDQPECRVELHRPSLSIVPGSFELREIQPGAGVITQLACLGAAETPLCKALAELDAARKALAALQGVPPERAFRALLLARELYGESIGPPRSHGPAAGPASETSEAAG
jgi:hypothetical protein